VKDSQIPAGGRLVGSREISKGVIEQEWLLPNGKIIKKQVSTSDVLDYVPPAPPTVPATPKKPEAIERRPGESPREFAQRRSRELQN
jgi:hypothetical protein